MADQAPTTESQNKVNAALRYAGTAAGTLFTLFGAMQFVTPDQVAQLTSAVHDFNQSVLSAYGALTKMWIILGPVAVFWLGKLGYQSSSVKALASKLVSIAANKADPKATEAKVALLDATASLPEVVGTIQVSDKTLEVATASDQIKTV